MTASDTLRRRLPHFRAVNKMTAQDLADRIAVLGGSMSRATIAKIEAGRRGVSLDEAFLLAFALNTSPIYLIVPVEDDDEPFEIAPDYITAAKRVRDWARGLVPLASQAARVFRTEVPDEEWEPIARRVPFGLEFLERDQADG